MICPYRICKHQAGCYSHTYFEDCYEEECPFFVPEIKTENLIRPAYCKRPFVERSEEE